ncbi:MAG: hypothetical protein ACREEH_01515, partial [Caulobacteraceae bacterium]
MTTGRSDSGIAVLEGGRAGAEGIWRRGRAGHSTPGELRPRLAGVLGWLRVQLALQEGRFVLWVPVAFGVGAALYLDLRTEPLLWPLALLFIGAAAAAI